MDRSFAERAVGVTPPRGFLLDASVLEHQEEHRIAADDIKLNRVEFVFPDGLNEIDLLEECRALTKTDDFDTMYDLTMQMLEGKSLTINIRNPDGSKSELCGFQVVDRFQNLRGVDMINEYPILVTWLTEFMGAHISKKCPMPGQSLLQPQASETDKGSDRKKQKTTP